MPENSKGPETDLWAEVTDSVRSAAASAAGVAQAAAAKAQEMADDLQAKAEETAQKFQDKADEAQERADEAPDGPEQDAAQEEADRAQEEADAAAERVQEFADRAQEEADEAQEAADEAQEAEDEAQTARDEKQAGRDDVQGARDSVQAARDEEQAARDEEQEAASSTPAGTSASADEQIRSILAMVADGSIDPDSAAKLIDEVKAGAASVGDDTTTKTQPKTDSAKPADAPPVNAVAATKLRIRAVGRRVRIIGEPFVSTVAVDGPHVIRQEGDTLIVTSEGEFGASLDGFQLLRSRSLSEVPERVFGFGRELSIRVNPRLLVEAEITAGSINTERLPSLEQVRVTAGSAKLRDVEGPIDLLVQAGSAQVEGRISRGESRLRAESGSVTLHLWPGSNVRIKPDIQLGQVKWEPPGKDRKEHIVGAGDAKLSLEVMMGAATVREAQ